MLLREGPWSQIEVHEKAAGTQAALGWVLHPDFEGRGYATEAVRALIEFCFATLGMRPVTAYCFEANEPSWRLMDRLGMRREEQNIRDSPHRPKCRPDGLAYSHMAGGRSEEGRVGEEVV